MEDVCTQVNLSFLVTYLLLKFFHWSCGRNLHTKRPTRRLFIFDNHPNTRDSKDNISKSSRIKMQHWENSAIWVIFRHYKNPTCKPWAYRMSQGVLGATFLRDFAWKSGEVPLWFSKRNALRTRLYPVISPPTNSPTRNIYLNTYRRDKSLKRTLSL